MRILVYGEYNADDMRNVLMINGFRQLGHRVTVLHLPKSRFRIHLWVRSILHLWNKEFDVVYVGFSGLTSVIPAKFISRKTRSKLVINPNIFFYETHVEDRRRFHPDHPVAKLYKLFDRLCVRLADIVVADSTEHIRYYMENLERANYIPLPLGVDEGMINYSKPSKINDRSVLFYGSYVPLQGVDVIVKAAKILEHEDIQFMFIGEGQILPMIKQMASELELKNIQFMDSFVPFDELRKYILESTVVLGVFSGNPKSMRVVPNKVYQGIALGKCVITQDCLPVREFLNPGHDVLTVEPNNPRALADKIREILLDSERRREIEKAALKTSMGLYSDKLASRLLSYISDN